MRGEVQSCGQERHIFNGALEDSASTGAVLGPELACVVHAESQSHRSDPHTSQERWRRGEGMILPERESAGPDPQR